MGSSSACAIQNALILNLIVFLAGVMTHNTILDFSYLDLLNMNDISMLRGLLGYFTLANSSAIITGMFFVFAYTALCSLARLLLNKRSYAIVVRPSL